MATNEPRFIVESSIKPEEELSVSINQVRNSLAILRNGKVYVCLNDLVKALPKGAAVRGASDPVEGSYDFIASANYKENWYKEKSFKAKLRREDGRLTLTGEAYKQEDPYPAPRTFKFREYWHNEQTNWWYTSKYHVSSIPASDVYVELEEVGSCIRKAGFELITMPNPNLVNLLERIEDPLDRNCLMDNGKRIGIKPHNANDGYVTIGYGHAIQSAADAEKYGFSFHTKQPVSDIINAINNQLSTYGQNLHNPAILSMLKARELFIRDITAICNAALPLCEEYHLSYSQNQLDAIISNMFNAGTSHKDDPQSFQYYILRNDREGAMDILRWADREGIYDSNTGLLRRRLMEFNVYFRNNYAFYNDTQLEILKTVTGF